MGSSPTDDISANSVGVCSQTSANAQWQCYGDSWWDLDSVPIPWRGQALQVSNLPALIVGVDEVCGKHSLFSGRDSRLRKNIFERSHADLRGYGATVARVTPDHKVGSSNLSGLIRHVGAVCNSIACECH